MTISQLVETLISAGVIPAGGAEVARAVALTLGQSGIASTTASSSTPALQILKPNGGENWQIDLDLPYSITWSPTVKLPVEVSLVATDKKVCHLFSGPILPMNGANSFKVLLRTAKCLNQVTGTSTALVAGSYKARVSYTALGGQIITDESDAIFKILPEPIPLIRVISPNGGETLTRNREYIVKYELKNAKVDNTGLIYFYILDSNGNVVYNSRKKALNGSFKFTPPSTFRAGSYKLRLKLTTSEHVEIEDTSNNFFKLITGL